MENLPVKQKRDIISNLFESKAEEMAKAVPMQINPERLARISLTAILSTPKLLACSPASLMACVMDAAQLGLPTDNVLGQAYLIPYKTKATLQIGYRGFIELAMRSEKLLRPPRMELVYEEDQFSLVLGSEPKIEHVPALKPRQDVAQGLIGSYTTVDFKGGGHDFEFMMIEEINKIRNLSQGYRRAEKGKKDSPWHTWYGEMVKKTVLRRMAKRLPLTPEFQKAAVYDEYSDAGLINVTPRSAEHLNNKKTPVYDEPQHTTPEPPPEPEDETDTKDKLLKIATQERLNAMCMVEWGKPFDKLTDKEIDYFHNNYDKIAEAYNLAMSGD